LYKDRLHTRTRDTFLAAARKFCNNNNFSSIKKKDSLPSGFLLQLSPDAAVLL